MGKRLHDTEIWEQDWFIELPNKYKLFWFYVKDRCDNAGFWRPNKSTFQKIAGEPISVEDFISFVNTGKERIKILPTGRWFIKEFFVFQYGDKFSPTSHVHKGALKTLVQNGVHPSEILSNGIGNLKNLDLQQIKDVAYDKDINTLNIAYGNPYIRVKDKDINKDKDNKRGAGGNLLRGVKIDVQSKLVFFEDGSSQKLGQSQEQRIREGGFEPHYIKKGQIE